MISSIATATARGALGRTFMLEKTATGIPNLVIVFDAIESEVPEFEANVSLVPVEDSQPEITDHVQIRNPTLSLTGVISESPIDLSVQVANIAASGFAAATNSQVRGNLLNSGLSSAAGVIGGDLLGGASVGSAAAGALDIIARQILLSAYERAARLTVVTRRQQFENMIIKKISFPRDRNTGRQTRFTIELQQIRVVVPFLANVSSTDEGVVVSAVPNQSLGSQSLGAITDSVSEGVDSLLSFLGGS